VAAGRRTETGLFIQGLIQIAVAQLKWFQGFRGSATRMALAGLEKMRRINGIYLGIEVGSFRSSIESYFSGETETPVMIKLVR